MSLSALPSEPGLDADPHAADPNAMASAIAAQVEAVVRGKPDVVRLALCALLAGEHLLVEDVPGTGKTMLARSLAAAVGGEFRRIQCTPDLLPGDLTGTTVYDARTSAWSFRPGPVFANVVLVDELNRASPRTQAALLEPMEEGSVSVDGETHALPSPSFVIATQNPFGSAGTFALPESQLDRFGAVVALGVPDRAAQRSILRGDGGATALDDVVAVTTPVRLRAAIAATAAVHVAPPVLEYLLDLAEATRRHAELVLGASPRAVESLLRLARAHAVIEGRGFVAPDDIQVVFAPALAHRVMTIEGLVVATATRILGDLAAAMPVPVPG